MKTDVEEIKNSVTVPYSCDGLYEKVDGFDNDIEEIKSGISSIQYDISEIKSSS